MWIGFLTVVQDLGRFKPLLKVFDRTKAVTQYLLEKSLKKIYKKRKQNTNKVVFLNICCVLVFFGFFVLCVCLCTGHFVMVSLKALEHIILGWKVLM